MIPAGLRILQKTRSPVIFERVAMTVFVLHDNTPVSSEVQDDIGWKNFENQFLDMTLGGLTEKSDGKPGLFLFPQTLSDSGDLDEEQRILFKRHRNGDTALWTGNVMGFVGYEGGDLLYITSRFGGTEPGVYKSDERANGGLDDGDQGIHDYFLNYMLGRVFDFDSINITKWMTCASAKEQAQRLYMLMFPALLRWAWNQGVYRQYVQRSFNDANLHGAIDIARHLRANIPFTGRIAYNTREFSADNPVNQLVRHTIEYLLESVRGRWLLQGVGDIVKQLCSLTPSYRRSERMAVLQYNLRTPVRHGFYRSYRLLQRLCIRILRHTGLSYVGDRQIHGILFDGAWLWEEYLNTVIGDAYFHPRNKDRRGAQYLFEGKTGVIYPDFISRTREGRTVERKIVDAKYKKNIGSGNDDYYQMLAYMFRFEAKDGYFAYPAADVDSDGNKPVDTRLPLRSGARISAFAGYGGERQGPGAERADGVVMVHKLGLRIPNVTADISYERFCLQMGQREEALRLALGVE